MAAASTLIRNHTSAVADGQFIHLRLAMPMTGSVTVGLPLPDDHVDELAARLRIALMRHPTMYNTILGVWVAMVRIACGEKL